MTTLIDKAITQTLKTIELSAAKISRRRMIEGFRVDPKTLPSFGDHRVETQRVSHHLDHWTSRSMLLRGPNDRFAAEVTILVALKASRHIRHALAATYFPRSAPLAGPHRPPKGTQPFAVGDFTYVHQRQPKTLNGQMVDFVVRNIAVRIQPRKNKKFPSATLAKELAHCIEARAVAGFTAKELTTSPYGPRVTLRNRKLSLPTDSRLDLELRANDACGSNVSLFFDAVGGAVARQNRKDRLAVAPYFFRAGARAGRFTVNVVAVNGLGLMASKDIVGKIVEQRRRQ